MPTSSTSNVGQAQKSTDLQRTKSVHGKGVKRSKRDNSKISDDDVNAKLLKIIENPGPVNAVPTVPESKDEDELFLKSLIPLLKKLPDDKKQFIKLELHSTILKAVYPQPQAQSGNFMQGSNPALAMGQNNVAPSNTGFGGQGSNNSFGFVDAMSTVNYEDLNASNYGPNMRTFTQLN